jgi:hypothetical protein
MEAAVTPFTRFRDYIGMKYTVVSTIQKTNERDVITLGRWRLCRPAIPPLAHVFTTKEDGDHKCIVNPQERTLPSASQKNNDMIREQVVEFLSESAPKIG